MCSWYPRVYWQDRDIFDKFALWDTRLVCYSILDSVAFRKERSREVVDLFRVEYVIISATSIRVRTNVHFAREFMWRWTNRKSWTERSPQTLRGSFDRFAVSFRAKIKKKRAYSHEACKPRGYLQLGEHVPKSGINYLSRSCSSRFCHKHPWKRAAGMGRNVSCILTLTTEPVILTF